MALRKGFEDELKLLHKDVIKMGALIEESLDMTIDVIDSFDIDKANEVINRDDAIDDLEMRLESACITMIYKQQPVASDLRIITSILKMITDLERIADNCADICDYVIKLADTKTDMRLGDIRKMALKVKEMLHATIESYINLDSKKAIETAGQDDIVDDYFEKIIIQIQEKTLENPKCIIPGTYFLFIIKYLERMADHSTNICEWIAYRVTGQHRTYN